MVPNACVLMPTRNLVTVNEEHFNSDFSFFDGCIWLQYTGHDDENGVEIYEGDFMKQTYKGKVEFANLEVIWNGSGFMLFNHDEKDEDYQGAHTFPLNYSGEFEVWGNKFENTVIT